MATFTANISATGPISASISATFSGGDETYSRHRFIRVSINGTTVGDYWSAESSGGNNTFSGVLPNDHVLLEPNTTYSWRIQLGYFQDEDEQVQVLVDGYVQTGTFTTSNTLSLIQSDGSPSSVTMTCSGIGTGYPKILYFYWQVLDYYDQHEVQRDATSIIAGQDSHTVELTGLDSDTTYVVLCGLYYDDYDPSHQITLLSCEATTGHTPTPEECILTQTGKTETSVTVTCSHIPSEGDTLYLWWSFYDSEHVPLSDHDQGTSLAPYTYQQSVTFSGLTANTKYYVQCGIYDNAQYHGDAIVLRECEVITDVGPLPPGTITCTITPGTTSIEIAVDWGSTASRIDIAFTSTSGDSLYFSESLSPSATGASWFFGPSAIDPNKRLPYGVYTITITVTFVDQTTASYTQQNVIFIGDTSITITAWPDDSLKRGYYSWSASPNSLVILYLNDIEIQRWVNGETSADGYYPIGANGTYTFRVDVTYIGGDTDSDSVQVVIVDAYVRFQNVHTGGSDGKTIYYEWTSSLNTAWIVGIDETQIESSDTGATHGSGSYTVDAYGTTYTLKIDVTFTNGTHGWDQIDVTVDYPQILSFTVSKVAKLPPSQEMCGFTFTCNAVGTYYWIEEDMTTQYASGYPSNVTTSGNIILDAGRHVLTLHVNFGPELSDTATYTITIGGQGAQAYIYATKNGVTQWWPATAYVYANGAWQLAAAHIYSGGWQ